MASLQSEKTLNRLSKRKISARAYGRQRGRRKTCNGVVAKKKKPFQDWGGMNTRNSPLCFDINKIPFGGNGVEEARVQRIRNPRREKKKSKILREK